MQHCECPAGGKKKKKLNSVRKKLNSPLKDCLVLSRHSVHHPVIGKLFFRLFLSSIQNMLAFVIKADRCQCGVALSEQLCCVGGVAFLCFSQQRCFCWGWRAPFEHVSFVSPPGVALRTGFHSRPSPGATQDLPPFLLIIFRLECAQD